MTRRSFFAALAAIPLAVKALAEAKPKIKGIVVNESITADSIWSSRPCSDTPFGPKSLKEAVAELKGQKQWKGEPYVTTLERYEQIKRYDTQVTTNQFNPTQGSARGLFDV